MEQYLKKFLIVLFLFVSMLQAEIAQMRIIGNAEKLDSEMVGKRDLNGRFCAGIKIISDLANLRYTSYNGVVKVDHKPGADLVYVSSNERVLEIFHTGHEPIKIILSELGINLNEKEVWQIKLTGDRTFIDNKEIITHRLTVKFNTDNVYVKNGDFAPTKSTGNSAMLDLAAGEYDLVFTKNNFIDQEKQ